MFKLNIFKYFLSLIQQFFNVLTFLYPYKKMSIGTIRVKNLSVFQLNILYLNIINRTNVFLVIKRLISQHTSKYNKTHITLV